MNIYECDTAPVSPGPWSLRRDFDAFKQPDLPTHLIDVNGVQFATVRGRVWAPVGATEFDTEIAVQHMKNCQVIAAAPELLDACKSVLTWLRGLELSTDPGDPLRKIREDFHRPYKVQLEAAIQKAEGNQ